ncbi:hypothetical protein M8818_000027 [Zalaria obscura]|uniref:Uncharacterized protein n=1 Tax=Zalaria obscura TaxID=2024903 RepID=A0ACC3SNW9_9PEZI
MASTKFTTSKAAQMLIQDRIYSYIVAQRSEHNPTWATLHETRKYPIMAVSHQIRCGFLSVFAQTHPVRRWFYFFLDLPRREGLPSAVAKCNVCDQWAVNLLRSTYVKRTTKFPSNPTPLPPPLSFVSTLKIKITQRRVGCPRETLARATIRFPRVRDSVPTFELKKVKKLGAKSSARFESFVSNFRGRLERWWKDEKRRRYSAAFARLLDPNSSETAAYMEMWKSGLWA